MIRAFSARRPWVAVIVALISIPTLAMLYLGRAGWALAYLTAAIVAGVLSGTIIALWLPDLSIIDALAISEWPLVIIGAVHAGFIARHRSADEPLKWYSKLPILLAIIGGYVGLVLLNKYFLLPPYYMPSEGMMPTLEVNDMMVASRRAYDCENPKRGDVIAFNVERARAVYVKRIIGMPGERVQMRQGIVFINGKPLVTTRTQHDAMEIVPETHKGYIVRQARARDYYLDNTEEVTVPLGHYYVIGDNRDNSMDSRAGEWFGFVAREDIVGKAVLKFYDGPKHRVVWQRID